MNATDRPNPPAYHLLSGAPNAFSKPYDPDAHRESPDPRREGVCVRCGRSMTHPECLRSDA